MSARLKDLEVLRKAAKSIIELIVDRDWIGVLVSSAALSLDEAIEKEIQETLWLAYKEEKGIE